MWILTIKSYVFEVETKATIEKIDKVENMCKQFRISRKVALNFPLNPENLHILYDFHISTYIYINIFPLSVHWIFKTFAILKILLQRNNFICCCFEF